MSPAVSQAQFKKMEVLYKQGKITKRELDKFTKGVDYRHLPTRKTVPKRKPAKKKSKRRGN